MILATLALTAALTLTPTAIPAHLSPAALDMTGIKPSLYQGPAYSAKHEKIRRCIIRRESHGNYRAANKTSSARGAYQFLDRAWRDSLVWMMLAESKQTRDGLTEEIRALRTMPISKWNRYFQDRAFWTAWRHGAGAAHWHYSPKPCT